MLSVENRPREDWRGRESPLQEALAAEPESTGELGRFWRRPEEKKAVASQQSLNQDPGSTMRMWLVTPPHPAQVPLGSYLEQLDHPPPETQVLSETTSSLQQPFLSASFSVVLFDRPVCMHV